MKMTKGEALVIVRTIQTAISQFAERQLPALIAPRFVAGIEAYHNMAVKQLASRLDELEKRIATAEKSALSYGGIWRQGDRHHKGAMVTDRGSLWFCWKETTQRPGTTEDWQLCVKSADSQKGR